MSKLFEESALWVRRIAEFCFYACLVIAFIMSVIGAIKFLSALEYDSFTEVLSYTAADFAHGSEKYVNGYMGKMLCISSFFVALSSLLSIPLYAFGCLVEDVADIKKIIVNNEIKAKSE